MQIDPNKTWGIVATPFAAMLSFILSRMYARKQKQEQWHDKVETNFNDLKLEHVQLKEQISVLKDDVKEIKDICVGLEGRLWQIKSKK